MNFYTFQRCIRVAYSTAALLAIVFAIPFGIRMLVHKDRGQWEEFGPAFYTAHLELFLGNGCLGKLQHQQCPKKLQLTYINVA